MVLSTLFMGNLHLLLLSVFLCVCELFAVCRGMALRLTDLSKDEAGIITGFDEANVQLCMRLREIGFAEGDNVTPLHFGLFGKNPISVRVNGALIALRRCLLYTSPSPRD